MTRAVLVLLLGPFAAHAQLALFSVNGITETAVGSAYNMGEIPGGTTNDAHLRARPSGAAAVAITKLAVSGAGFSITSPLTTPPSILPGAFLDIYVHFSGGPPNYYTASFQINSISVLLQVTALPAPALQVVTGCTGPDPSTSAIAFGPVPIGQAGPCAISLVNLNPQPVSITTLAVSGAGFQIAAPVQTPFTMPPGGTFALTINLVPTSAATYSGLLTVSTPSLVQSFPLAGTGQIAQLTLFTVNGTTETPVGTSYSMGQVAAGNSINVRLRARNSGSAAIPITSLAISGFGFSITSPLTPPPNIPLGNFLDIFIQFSGGPPASYGANFQINNISVLLQVTAVAAPTVQLELFTVNGTTETPVGTSYSMGQVAAGNSTNVRLRARNSGSAAIPITSLAISGFGFSITSPLTPPPNIPPGNFLDIYIQFSGGPPASYGANFEIDNISVLLQVTAVAAPTISVSAPCTGAVGFGAVQSLQLEACVISLQNLNAQSVIVAVVAISGMAFQIVPAVQTPLTIASGKTASFTIAFSPTASAVYSGLLTVDTQTFPLTGTGLTPPLPTPILAFDSGVPASAQQVNLTMSLPAPSPEAASGSVNIAFQPDSPLITDDPAVAFAATGARSVSFSIQPGDTQILLGGQAGAIFQTGTSSGRITFTVKINVAMSGDPTAAMTIPPAIVFVESASAIARSGALDVQVWGFDNTYSAGNMAFTFYDLTGKTIAPGAISADFTSNFRTYFTSAQAGSAFQMLVTFPVTGDASQVGAVDLQMTNTAGSIATQHLTTISEIPDCVKVSSSKVVCTPPP